MTTALGRCLVPPVAAALALAAGCGGGGESEDCAVGSEGCACTMGGGCDPGLACLSDLCVDPGTDDGGLDAAADAGTDGGDDAATDTGVDSGPTDGAVDAGPTDGAVDAGAGCDPVAQEGCEEGDKCTWIVDDPDTGDGHTGCVADGTASAGESCTAAEAGEADECVAGTLCSGGTCTEICSTSPEDSCGSGACLELAGLFGDLDATGLCVPTCEPRLQDCAEDAEACYTRTTETAVVGLCAAVPTDATGREQGDECVKSDSGECFDNGCAAGYGPELLADGATMIDRCAYYCEPQETYYDSEAGELVFDDPDGDGMPNPEGNPTTTNEDGLPAACTTATAGGGDYHCRFLQTSYTFPDGVTVPPTMGFCAPVGSDWGDCTTYDPKAIAQFLRDNPGMTRDDFCSMAGNEDKCAFGCLREETRDAIFGDL